MSAEKVLVWVETSPEVLVFQARSSLERYGFLQSYSDYSLFTYTKGIVQINVLVYVDDLIISRNHSATLVGFKAYLGECFK